MIFIFDNAKAYSDHSMYFYEINIPDGCTPEEVGKALVLSYEFEWPDLLVKPHIVGVADKIEWWGGSTIKVNPESFKRVIRRWTHMTVDPDVRRVYREEYEALCKIVKAIDPGYQP